MSETLEIEYRPRFPLTILHHCYQSHITFLYFLLLNIRNISRKDFILLINDQIFYFVYIRIYASFLLMQSNYNPSCRIKLEILLTSYLKCNIS